MLVVVVLLKLMGRIRKVIGLIAFVIKEWVILSFVRRIAEISP